MTVLDTHFQLRPFFCPIEPAIHSRADTVEKRAIEWIDRFRFYQGARDRARVIGTNSAEFYSRFAPQGIEDNLLAAVCWVYWGFAFDDARCDAGTISATPNQFLSMAGRLQRALETPWHPVAEDDSFALALQDIGRSFHRCATPVQVRRFADAHRAWLFAVSWQIANRSLDRMPDLHEYTTMRLNSAGGAPTVAMLEIANGAEVPADEMDSPAVRALTEMAILIASWDNDLHSYRKEADQRHADQNLVNVLVTHGGVTVEQAVDEAVAMRDRVMVRFLRLRERTAARRTSTALRVYLDCLGHAIRGNIDWALQVPRYVDFTDSEPRPTPVIETCWADAPADSSPDPLPIPAIAWWWDQLDS